MTKQDHDTAAVKKLAEEYAAAWGSGDPELLLSCYADDAVVIMSHEEPIVGKEALRELYQHVFGTGKTEEEGGKKTETRILPPGDGRLVEKRAVRTSRGDHEESCSSICSPANRETGEGTIFIQEYVVRCRLECLGCF